MVRFPKDITPGAAARRSAVADVLSAVVLAGGALIFCAGPGIVGVIAVLTLLLLLPWFAVEAVARGVSRRRTERTRAAPRLSREDIEDPGA